jgi:hypothetical protein
MEVTSMLRTVVFIGGISVRGAKLSALVRFRDTKAVHDASDDAGMKHDARVDWLAYEASVFAATGHFVILAARSHERALRSPSVIARSARDGRWVYKADAVIRAISSALTLDADDIAGTIERIVRVARPPTVHVLLGGKLARLEAARAAIDRCAASVIANEVAVVSLPELVAAIATAAASAGTGTGTGALTDPVSALMAAHEAASNGTGGLRRLHVDAACLLHSAGLTDQVGTVLNRIGPDEFDAYATALAVAQK